MKDCINENGWLSPPPPPPARKKTFCQPFKQCWKKPNKGEILRADILPNVAFERGPSVVACL